jgi:hypothetical protein
MANVTDSGDLRQYSVNYGAPPRRPIPHRYRNLLEARQPLGGYTQASAGSIFPICCRQRLFVDASNVELSNVEHIGHPLARSIRKQNLTMPGGSEVSEPV